MRQLRLALLVVIAALLAGCPKRPGPAPGTADQAVVTSPAAPVFPDVHFDTDRATIRPGDAQLLEAGAEWLQDHPDVMARVEGYADERGTPVHNSALGQRRARTVRDFLVARCVEAKRLRTVSFGEERPLCTERTSLCLARNRRVHLAVGPPPGQPPSSALSTPPGPTPAPTATASAQLWASGREVAEHP